MVEDKGKFLEVACGRCGVKQILFGKSSTKVKCEKCNKLLVKTGGGKIKIKSVVKEVLKE